MRAPRRLPLRLLIGGDLSISCISRRGEGAETESQPPPPGTSAPSRRDLGLSPLATAWTPSSYPPPATLPPEKWRPPAAKKATSGPDRLREAGASFPGPRGTIAALEARRSPRPNRQDASYLVPREERVFVQDGPAGLGGRRPRGALHAALAEREQPLRLLRGAGRLLSLHELPGGGR